MITQADPPEKYKAVLPSAPNSFAPDDKGFFQVKLIFIAVAVISVLWIGVLAYVGLELFRKILS